MLWREGDLAALATPPAQCFVTRYDDRCYRTTGSPRCSKKQDMTAREIVAHDLSRKASHEPLKQALQHLRQEQHRQSAITVLCRLSSGYISEHSYLVTAGIAESSVTGWLVAFVDRSRRPETELYLASSWETEDGYDVTIVQDMLRRFMLTVRSLGMPPSIHADHGDTGRSRPLLCGAVHERTYAFLKDAGMLSLDYAGLEVGYRTFLFDVEKLPSPAALPVGLHWGELKAEHYEVVRTTSTIPRQDATLAMLPSVAIFDGHDDTPIAWGFVGLDGSLSTLYVMPSHRGQGLGSRLCLKLLKEKMSSFFGSSDRQIGHSFVAPDNMASIRTSQRAGGIDAGHAVYWLRVDLDNI